MPNLDAKNLNFDVSELPPYEDMAKALLDSADFIFIDIRQAPDELYVTLSIVDDSLVAELLGYDVGKDQEKVYYNHVFHKQDDDQYAEESAEKGLPLAQTLEHIIKQYNAEKEHL